MMQTIIAFLCAILSALGMGGGSILLIYLTVVQGVDQLQAQGMNLSFFLPVALVAILFHLRHGLIQKKTAIVFILIGLIGVWVGAKAAMQLDKEILSKCFGGLLLIMGIRELWPKRRQKAEKQTGKQEG